MTDSKINRVHLVTGGFPPGQPAGHDIDYARLQLLNHLNQQPSARVTVSGDFADLDKWLAGSKLLISYVSGPFPDAEQNTFLASWLNRGGRWLALHGTSGGKAERVPDDHRRRMVKLPHHETLGCFFLNHPPLRRFEVAVCDTGHPITQGLPDRFEVADELYLVEVDLDRVTPLLTTEQPEDPSPTGFGFIYDADTSLLSDGRTRILGYEKQFGQGAIVYIALGHCHSPTSNSQPFVDASISGDGKTPKEFRGAWEGAAFNQLLVNGINWGLRQEGG